MLQRSIYGSVLCLLLIGLVNQEESPNKPEKKSPGKKQRKSVADTDIYILMQEMLDERMKPPPTNESKLDKYFKNYCDYTGGLGIGFVASHTYDFKFRQHLKRTRDEDLKRLFVLQHLYSDLDRAVRNFGEGIIYVGKVETRKMTSREKKAIRKKLLKQLDDLEEFDPKDPEGEIARHREALK